MFDDQSRPPRNRPAVDLLNELESIKGALIDSKDDENSLPADIPLLEDMVISNLNQNAKLLNLGQIFEEEAEEESATLQAIPTDAHVQFPRFTLDVAISDDLDVGEAPDLPPASPARQHIRRDYSREALIQELIDDFLPEIEAELHARLSQLDDTALRRLKDPK